MLGVTFWTRTSRVVPLLFLVGCHLVGCHEEVPAGTDDAAFSVMDPARGDSILPAIENSHGRPVVCLALLGFEGDDRATAASQIEALVTDAATKWNRLLDGDPEWALQQTDVVPEFHVQDTECPKNGPGFSVNVWATADRFKAEYCSRPNYTCSSGAIPRYRTLYLGPWNRTKPADIFEPYRTLHEYGHLLGLGDTYRRPGVADWSGDQPASVMSGKSRVLTDDDKLGLWVTLRALKTGVRSCDGFGNDVAMTANTKNVLMCEPRAEPENDHAPPSPIAEPVFPVEGLWAYEGYPLESTSMRISAVSREGSGFRMTVTAFRDGTPSGTGTIYRCSANGACAAATNAQYRILTASATSLRLINPKTPAGIQVEFAKQ